MHVSLLKGECKLFVPFLPNSRRSGRRSCVWIVDLLLTGSLTYSNESIAHQEVVRTDAVLPTKPTIPSSIGSLTILAVKVDEYKKCVGRAF